MRNSGRRDFPGRRDEFTCLPELLLRGGVYAELVRAQVDKAREG